MTYLTLTNGLEIDFLINFAMPQDFLIYHNFNITDKLADGLEFVPDKTYLKVNDKIIPGWTYKYDKLTNELNINVINDKDIAGNILNVYLMTKVIDKSKIEEKLEIQNSANVSVNNVSELTTKSQDIKVKFETIKPDQILISEGSENSINTLVSGYERALSLFFLTDAYDKTTLSYNIVTTLPQGLIFDIEKSSVEAEPNGEVNTLRIVSNEKEEIYAEYLYNSGTGKLQINISNSEKISQKILTVKIGVKVQNADIIKESENLDFILLKNNDESSILSESTVRMNFIEQIKLSQYVDTPIKLLEKGTKLIFTGVFTVPYNTTEIIYNTFTISDSLPDGLIFDLKNSSIKLDDGSFIKSQVLYPQDGQSGEISITFFNYSDIQGKNVFVNIGAVLDDIEKIPQYLLIQNTLSLVINGDLDTKIDSDPVIVKFEDYTKRREQSLINVIASITKVEKALNDLISYQPELYFKSKEIGGSLEELSEVNDSINDLLKAAMGIQEYEGMKLNIADKG